jgi:YidC/Oxa1 family membrane protein insertase
MYDRKTWVIVALCAGLLAVNMHYSSQQRAEEAKQRHFVEEAQKAAKAAEAAATTDPAASAAAALNSEASLPPTEEETFVLENDKVAFTFTNIGGGIKQALFKDQFQVGSKTRHIIVNDKAAAAIGSFADSKGESFEKTVFAFPKGENPVAGKKVSYIATLPSGLIVKKTYSLIDPTEPGAPYLLDFDLSVQNEGAGALNLGQWSIFLGEAAPLYQKEDLNQTGFFWRENGSMHFEEVTGFSGGTFSKAKSLITSPNDEAIEFGGVANQFFTTVLRAKNPVVSEVWGRSSPYQLTDGEKTLHSIRAGLRLPETNLNQADGAKTFSYRLFIGPKDNTMLRKMDNRQSGWGDVMQYGFFSPVSRVLNFILNFLHTGLDKVSKEWSWGLAIIFLTIIVRGAIWPLHAKSTRTMKRMSKLQPEMAKLKEKYPDDPNKLNTEMMGLYKKYGINPLGGCLPMLLQIPIFFGFFRMLQYAVEFRGQGFLWVQDLSQPDTLTHVLGIPINILPIVMGVTSFLQIAMTPKTGDKMQQRIIMFMPLIFFIFCYSFASALALYWTTQNIFSIGQTWLMNKIPEPELKPRADGGKKSWVQRMAERQMELQKAREKGGHGGSGGTGMRDVTPDKKKPRGPRTGG